jgi:carbamate kinase
VRIVIALGGNALLLRGERPDAAAQRGNIRSAARAVARVGRRHQVVVTHGNGPQIGLLALESERDRSLSVPYPLDVLGAETEGMIGYWLAQELGNELPGIPVTTLLTQTVVDPGDPDFTDPSKFIGPMYDEARATSLAGERGWVVKPDGPGWRRVVASPPPLDIVELPSIRLLMRHGVLVVCAGGGGVPVARDRDGRYVGVEAVVDKDHASSLLASRLGADVLLMLTDVAGVYTGWGKPAARRIEKVTNGSMGPKVAAACAFVRGGGRLAGIGALTDAAAIIAGRAGTLIGSPASLARMPTGD